MKLVNDIVDEIKFIKGFPMRKMDKAFHDENKAFFNRGVSNLYSTPSDRGFFF
jgi:hypothetical protein